MELHAKPPSLNIYDQRGKDGDFLPLPAFKATQQPLSTLLLQYM